MREEARAVRPRTSVLGARLSPDNRPVVTITFIAICVLLFVADYVSPTLRMRLIFAPVLGQVEPYRMITTAFLHAGIVHLLFNMYALWIVGPFLEQMLGRWRYIALYLLSALGGSVAVLALAGDDVWNVATVGASGAVFGLFAAIAVVLRRTGREARQILIVIGINVVVGFVIPGISWQAHLGGLVTGAALGALFAYLPKKERTRGAIAGVALVAAILVGITVGVYS
ncbi:rhomboid family intramembrane serine protease [Occultella kanbiaonis]|uniref:rhomboid family intramembrane serine protease n=1 Tax=Occultella kanbiaonis TaxID=2675754 RepID=UPI002E2C54BD|nr:rhomboid family intramembrane serine protease [Occultella kanbiaonis]